MDGGRMQPRFALHPGPVTSQNDGDEQYVTVGQLAKLYQLAFNEYIVWRPHLNYPGVDAYNRPYEDFIHLYPRHDGQYGRPEEFG